MKANLGRILFAAVLLAPTVALAHPGDHSAMTLAQIASFSPAGLQLPNINAGGRMWFSFYQPMNMPIVPGPGVVQPNIGNPSDPNINTVFDWMEFAEGSDWIYCNTTQVNMFGIPYTMSLYNQGPALNGTDGINDCYADIVQKYKAFMAAIPDGMGARLRTKEGSRRRRIGAQAGRRRAGHAGPLAYACECFDGIG